MGGVIRKQKPFDEVMRGKTQLELLNAVSRTTTVQRFEKGLYVPETDSYLPCERVELEAFLCNIPRTYTKVNSENLHVRFPKFQSLDLVEHLARKICMLNKLNEANTEQLKGRVIVILDEKEYENVLLQFTGNRPSSPSFSGRPGSAPLSESGSVSLSGSTSARRIRLPLVGASDAPLPVDVRVVIAGESSLHRLLAAGEEQREALARKLAIVEGPARDAPPGIGTVRSGVGEPLFRFKLEDYRSVAQKVTAADLPQQLRTYYKIFMASGLYQAMRAQDESLPPYAPNDQPVVTELETLPSEYATAQSGAWVTQSMEGAPGSMVIAQAPQQYSSSSHLIPIKAL
eukprot:TRINITY_DN96524_c0_g1_i1.p1 TRINITY_DN96524_c0_g1~~TRINITY_DN96524_c0_g1_i1.p1  ORF type:complete len:344 (-),score=53.55 TRINITY_DN96524_c0_g1_i1:63-1094(-)